MLTWQTSQQLLLVVMQPNQAKSFPAATVWYIAAAESVGSEARKVEMLGGHTQVSKIIDDGEVAACLRVLYPTRRKNEGKTLGRKHLELSDRRRALGQIT